MKRKEFDYLEKWMTKSNRRPLIIRGARQVGKTHLIRDFGKIKFDAYIEYNFDLEKSKKEIFLKSDIHEILNLIAIDKGIKIVPGKTLLFLDEIQAVPELIARLRYFYEMCPDLHVIGAGSLLDFALEEYEYSMPVGRIEYLFMGPMSYEEFLLAKNENELVAYIKNFTLNMIMPEVVHQKAMTLLKHYFYTGGMPAAVKAYVSGDILSVDFEHKVILQTFVDDFSKYKKRVNIDLLKTTFEKIPQLVGQKIKYVNISPHHQAKNVSEACALLSMARVITPVYHTAGNGVPLGAEIDEKCFKVVYLDIGLLLSALEINLTDIEHFDDLTVINSGALAEQFIGQHLLYRKNKYERPSLYYWHRMKDGSSSEVDYLVDIKNSIVPVEVKAGKAGALKSLQVFMGLKEKSVAVRFNTDTPSLFETSSAIPKINKKEFTLISLPLYMVDETERIVRDVL